MTAALIGLPSLFGPPTSNPVWLACRLTIEERRSERGGPWVLLGRRESSPVFVVDAPHRGFFIYDEGRRTLDPRPVASLTSEAIRAEQAIEVPVAGGGSEKSRWSLEVDRRTLSALSSAEAEQRGPGGVVGLASSSSGSGACRKIRPRVLARPQF